MNIALGAVLIFILLIPPIAFYISYTFGRHTRGGLRFSFLDGLLASAIFSLLVHSVAIFLIGKEIRFDILLKLAGGELKDLEGKINNEVFAKSLRQFAWYNFVILIIMISLGQIVRYIVRIRDIHGNYELLRIRNRWWYLFNGYYLTEVGYESRAFDNPFVDAVIDTNDGTLIYSGYLVDYVCNGEELDRIYLGGVFRREFKKKEVNEHGANMVNEPGEAKEIPGQFLCLAYSQIKNLNLRFIEVEESLEYVEEIADTIEPDDELTITIHTEKEGHETATKEKL